MWGNAVFPSTDTHQLALISEAGFPDLGVCYSGLMPVSPRLAGLAYARSRAC